jgi:hypothetical protein
LTGNNKTGYNARHNILRRIAIGGLYLRSVYAPYRRGSNIPAGKREQKIIQQVTVETSEKPRITDFYKSSDNCHLTKNIWTYFKKIIFFARTNLVFKKENNMNN